MKECKLTIEIDRPVADVFLFSIDPNSSPKWIDSFAEERTSTWPVTLGTIYRNRGETGGWNEYTVTAFIENEVFELTSQDGAYCVRWVYEATSPATTRILYHEWAPRGELDCPFEIAALEKLKRLLEEGV